MTTQEEIVGVDDYSPGEQASKSIEGVEKFGAAILKEFKNFLAVQWAYQQNISVLDNLVIPDQIPEVDFDGDAIPSEVREYYLRREGAIWKTLPRKAKLEILGISVPDEKDIDIAYDALKSSTEELCSTIRVWVPDRLRSEVKPKGSGKGSAPAPATDIEKVLSSVIEHFHKREVENGVPVDTYVKMYNPRIVSGKVSWYNPRTNRENPGTIHASDITRPMDDYIESLKTSSQSEKRVAVTF